MIGCKPLWSISLGNEYILTFSFLHSMLKALRVIIYQREVISWGYDNEYIRIDLLTHDTKKQAPSQRINPSNAKATFVQSTWMQKYLKTI